MSIIRRCKVDEANRNKERLNRKKKDRINLRERKKRKKVKSEKKQKLRIKKYTEKAKEERSKIKRPADHRAPYIIIITKDKKTIGHAYRCMSKNTAIIAYDKIVNANKKSVRFPVKFSSKNHMLLPHRCEILLMKTKEQYDQNYSFLKNEFGKIVPHHSNSEKMIIFKKDEFLIEETFWVYGFHPREQRKTFIEIIESIILKDINTKSNIIQKRVLIYKNKLLIENEYGQIEMVMCKCEDDCIRFYYELEKEITKLKTKSIFFGGKISGRLKRIIIEKIQKNTGWNKTKIYRNSTRP